MNPTAKIILELTMQEIDIVLAGLGELQFKLSANTFMSVRTQRDAAMRKAAPVPLSVVPDEPKTASEGT